MKKFLFIILIFISSLFANDKMYEKQKNVLYVQNLIDIEEKIAREFENYMLKEFNIPTMSDLITKDYLGENFSQANLFGNNINFSDALNLKLILSVGTDQKNYLQALYKRDLYRYRTSVYVGEPSYVLISLKSKEAKTIHSILKDGKIINKNCDGVITSKYCNKNDNAIRWYDANGNWIEYDKAEFENANVTVEKASLLSDVKLNNLKVGVFIFLEDGTKFIKVLNTSMKVE